MLRWLIDEQGLSTQEAHLLIGMRARYDLITLGGVSHDNMRMRGGSMIPGARSAASPLIWGDALCQS